MPGRGRRLPLPVRPGLHGQEVLVRRHLQRLAAGFPVPVPARIHRRPLRDQNQRMRARLAVPQRRRLHRIGQQF